VLLAADALGYTRNALRETRQADWSASACVVSRRQRRRQQGQAGLSTVYADRTKITRKRLRSIRVIRLIDRDSVKITEKIAAIVFSA
jgi:hypothetical protein